MTAIAFDLEQPSIVARELGHANRRLAREPETPGVVVGLVEDVTDAIATGDEHQMAAVNPWLWIQLQGAALRAQAALRDDDPGRREKLRLAIEQMRFLFARIAEFPRKRTKNRLWVDVYCLWGPLGMILLAPIAEKTQ